MKIFSLHVCSYSRRNTYIHIGHAITDFEKVAVITRRYRNCYIGLENGHYFLNKVGKNYPILAPIHFPTSLLAILHALFNLIFAGQLKYKI
jgi:hypothetical protein